MTDATASTREHVERLLKNYQHNLRIMAASEEAIQRFVPVTEDEVLEMMNFGRSDGNFVQNTNVSQKVARISATYKKTAKAWNKEALRAIMLEFQSAWSEVAFIDYAIKHLPERECEIMSYFIFECASWTEVCSRFHLSNAMVGKIRKRAVERIFLSYKAIFNSFTIDLGVDER